MPEAKTKRAKSPDEFNCTPWRREVRYMATELKAVSIKMYSVVTAVWAKRYLVLEIGWDRSKSIVFFSTAPAIEPPAEEATKKLRMRIKKTPKYSKVRKFSIDEIIPPLLEPKNVISSSGKALMYSSKLIFEVIVG